MTICLPSFYVLLSSQFLSLTGPASKQQQINVFVQNTATIKQVSALLQQLQDIKGIASIERFSREQVQQQMLQLERELLSLSLSFFDTSPFGETFVLTPQQTLDEVEMTALSKRLEALPWVDKVAVDTHWSIAVSQLIDRIDFVLQMMSLVATVVVLVMLFNFALLRIRADEEELKVRLMLGVYPWRIYVPYLCLGGALGFCAGFLAAVFTYFAYGMIAYSLRAFVVSGVLREEVTVFSIELVWLPFISLVVGLLVSFVALSHCYVRVRNNVV